MKNIKSKSIKTCFGLILSLCFALPVFAADFEFGVIGKRVGVDQDFLMSVNLNTEGEKINAVSGAVVFDSSKLSVKSVQYYSSTVNFWVTEPKETSPGRLEFAGITPGGWSGDSAIFNIVFTAKEVGSLDVRLADGVVLKNDGVGTELTVTTKPLALFVQSEQVLGVGYLALEDKISPESFNIEVGKSPTVFDGKWLAAFSTQDKQTGINYYEVQETKNRVPDDNSWRKASSPYILTDQTRSSYIFVKAVDFAGNEKLAYALPQVSLLTSYDYLFGITIVLLICGIIYWLWRKRLVKQ